MLVKIFMNDDLEYIAKLIRTFIEITFVCVIIYIFLMVIAGLFFISSLD